jgi:hypothetical protein
MLLRPVQVHEIPKDIFHKDNSRDPETPQHKLTLRLRDSVFASGKFFFASEYKNVLQLDLGQSYLAFRCRLF